MGTHRTWTYGILRRHKQLLIRDPHPFFGYNETGRRTNRTGEKKILRRRRERSRSGQQRLTDDGFALLNTCACRPINSRPARHGVTLARRHLVDRDRRRRPFSTPVGEQPIVTTVAKVHQQTSPTLSKSDRTTF